MSSLLLSLGEPAGEQPRYCDCVVPFLGAGVGIGNPGERHRLPGSPKELDCKADVEQWLLCTVERRILMTSSSQGCKCNRRTGFQRVTGYFSSALF